MNKFQNTVKKLAIQREKEEFDAMEKEVGGTFEDFIEIVETPGEGPWVKVEFIHKDEEGYERWSKGVDTLRSFKEIKREVKAELRKGPRL